MKAKLTGITQTIARGARLLLAALAVAGRVASAALADESHPWKPGVSYFTRTL